MSPSLLLLSFFLFCVCDVVLCNEEGRPKLVKGTLSEGRKNFLGGEYEWIQSAFEFDQPLYLNEPIICADLEQSCPPLDCVPCDWTTPEKATSCWDEQCCTPSVPIQEKERWCPNSTTTNPPPPFTAIKVNEKSEIFKMDAQEERSFRVFIGEDLYCHPILLAMRSLYGNHNLFISSIVPTPNFGDIFVVPGTYYRQNLFSYGQSNTVLCPGTRGYTPGTYSLLVTAYEATEFYFEIVSAPDPLPQPPPPEVVSCDSVPPEVLVTPEGDQAICLEDGKTVTIDTQGSASNTIKGSFILPVPEGCHSVTFSAQNLKSESFADPDPVCLPPDIDENWADTGALARWTAGDDYLSFFGCYSKITYIRCSAFMFLGGNISFIWSSTSPFLRTPIVDVLPIPLATMTGLSALGTIRDGTPICGGFTGCPSWLLPPVSDPLTFWPPPDLPFFPLGHYDPLPMDLISLEVLQNTVIFMDTTLRAGRTYGSREGQLQEGSIAFFSLTNADGLPPIFPPSSAPPLEDEADFFDYISNIRYADLVPREKTCDQEKFQGMRELIEEMMSSITTSSSTNASMFTYYVELFNTQLVNRDCIESLISLFPTEIRTTTLSGLSCFFEEGTIEWEEDPCCNRFRLANQCCRFKTSSIETTGFVYEEQDELTCRTEECTSSYFSDFLRSYNDQFDRVIGCSPLLPPREQTNAELKLKVPELEKMRSCLNKVGFGDRFLGVPCTQDDECPEKCNKRTGICDVGMASELEDAFLTCYIEQISPFTEDYIRRKILSTDEQHLSRESKEFFSVLKKYASMNDCVNLQSPLDISQRTKIVLDHRELSSTPPCPNPLQFCLANEICIYNHIQCSPAFVPRLSQNLFKLSESSPESCAAVACSGECLAEPFCGFCFEDGAEDSCQHVEEGGVSQEECENSPGACRAPNGTIFSNLSEEECNQIQGECSILCHDEQCVSASQSDDGVCEVFDAEGEGECDGLGGTWVSSSCLVGLITKSECEASFQSSQWILCGEQDESSCSSSSTAPFSYLGCQWRSVSRPCSGKEECESAGECSDSHFLHLLESGETAGCLSAGIFPISTSESQFPLPSFGFNETLDSPLGFLLSLEAIGNEEDCLERADFEGAFIWVEGAKSEEECVKRELGKYGCKLPQSIFSILFLYDEEECECAGGTFLPAWSWSVGEWKVPNFLPLQWIEDEPLAVYEYVESLSYFTLESWVLSSVEERIILSTLAALTCEHNFTSVTADWLICDCYSTSSEECLAPSASKVGFGRVCANLSSTLIIPSAHIIFNDQSIREGCVDMDLAFLSHDGFSFLKKKPSITIQFAQPQNSGVVVNQKGVTVGTLVGDGVEISLSLRSFGNGISSIGVFDICLYIREGTNSSLPKRHNVPDFALLTGEDSMEVQYFEINSTVSSGYLFWCVSIEDVSGLINKTKKTKTNKEEESDDNQFTLFPVYRVENGEDEDVYSTRSVILAYILAGTYLVLFCFYTFLLLFNIKRFQTLLGTFVPFLFVAVCAFRSTYFLMWAQEQFVEPDEVVEFVLFETPSFFLLFLLLVLIYCWKSITKRRHGEIGNIYQRELVFGCLVILLYVAIIIAAVVLAENDSDDTSACPGRAPVDDSSLEDSMKTLSIAYTSIITFITLVLTAMAFYEARDVLKMMRKGFFTALFYVPASRFTFVFMIFFLIRCILFLVIYTADITSDIFIFVLLMTCEVIPCIILWLEVVRVAVKPISESHSSSRRASKNSSSMGPVSMGVHPLPPVSPRASASHTFVRNGTSNLAASQATRL